MQGPLRCVCAHLVVQRFNLFLLLSFTDLVRVCNLEELRSDLYQPLGFDRGYGVTVLAGREQQFVINQPLRCTIE